MYVQDAFTSMYGDRVHTAIAFAMNDEFQHILREKMVSPFYCVSFVNDFMLGFLQHGCVRKQRAESANATRQHQGCHGDQYRYFCIKVLQLKIIS